MQTRATWAAVVRSAAAAAGSYRSGLVNMTAMGAAIVGLLAVDQGSARLCSRWASLDRSGPASMAPASLALVGRCPPWVMPSQAKYRTNAAVTQPCRKSHRSSMSTAGTRSLMQSDVSCPGGAMVMSTTP